ncbi:cytochrome c biogenesis protein DipZ, partial [Candidatus Gottesmanbacteria bacterium]|nr:cytochrome c biogenesis protein DipZ [Candidatus Gottesmanbacteria bacterium]
MILLIAFAFLAGVVTILSPCILPVLPIVLSGGISGGKRRPLGIVTGFIVSFTFFTLFLTAIVRATGISPDALRSISVVIVIAFGLSLIVPKFQALFEQFIGKLSSLVASKNTQQDNQRQDFVGGLLIGLSLGLVWTPCVGPILASVISLALTGSVTSTAFFITLAYAIGTSIPMLAIVWGGRTLLQKNPWLVQSSGKIQKIFGILMILTALAIATNLDRKFQTYILQTFPQYGVGLTKFEDNAAVKKQLQNGTKKPVSEVKKGKPMFDVFKTDLGAAPEFISGGKWFNSQSLTVASLRGKVVLVDFWTYTCINCIRTLPYLKSWYAKYKDKGLVIIGVHTPEFEFEKNPDNVAKAIKDFGLEYPVMQDNDYATWNAYNNRYWPAKYLIDKDGRIRYTHFGEGNYDETEKKIQELLEEAGSTVQNVSISNPTYQVQTRTPETYLGYRRMDGLASPERVRVSEVSLYTAPVNLDRNSFALSGQWMIGDEYASPGQGASLIYRFDAKAVFLVMRPK